MQRPCLSSKPLVMEAAAVPGWQRSQARGCGSCMLPESSLQRGSVPSEEEFWAGSQDRDIPRRLGKWCNAPCLSIPTSKMGAILLLISLHFCKDQKRQSSPSIHPCTHPPIAENLIENSLVSGTMLSGWAPDD